MNVTTNIFEGGSSSVDLNHLPDRGPICHHGINPSFHFAFMDRRKWRQDNCLQAVLKCPLSRCQNVFISYYTSANSDCKKFEFVRSTPITKVNKNFVETIRRISEDFCTIYNQAFSAEQDNLLEICGVGYRKSLEFLIKDYLIKGNPEKKEEIKPKNLGRCISENIENENIKDVAKRAVWLGNDETHYLRKWESKDLQDLKKLIDLTVHWLEMEQITKETIAGMPEST